MHLNYENLKVPKSVFPEPWLLKTMTTISCASPDRVSGGLSELINNNTTTGVTEPMTKNETLTQDLHLRVSKTFHDQLNETAKRHNLKPSTFTRYVLMKHLQDYQSELLASSRNSVASRMIWYAVAIIRCSSHDPNNSNNKESTDMKSSNYLPKTSKLVSLKQFVEYMRESGVFAIEILDSEKDEMTIKLLFEDVWVKNLTHSRRRHWWV